VADPATRRVLKEREVTGAVGPFGNHVWRGIPFAQPPRGELRWRAPRPLDDWAGATEALRDGPHCAQGIARGGSLETTGSEDCLYLNVFAPPFEVGEVPRGEARLPVMVWIHGGGNSVGSAVPFDGGRLAREHQLIVVAVQYRLGPFGWFRHAALRGADDSAEDASGNYGTLDLIAALRWVHNNVSEFGGDPANVTVFGESAGGRNVCSLLLSPLSGSLFQRAIAQSGAFDIDPVAHAENPSDAADPGHANSGAEVVARLLVAHGGAADRGAALARAGALPPAELAAFLRARSADEVLQAMGAGGPGLGLIQLPQVFGDGTVLPAAQPLDLLAAGRYQRVPVILGSNRDEWKLFMSYDPRYVGRRLRMFPYAHDWTRYDRDAEYQSKVWKLNAVDAPAPLMRAVQGPSVYAYRFDWDDLPVRPWVDLKRLLGAAHGLDVPFVFGTFEMQYIPIPFDRGDIGERDELSAQMRSYWAQFAYSGDPGRGRSGVLPEWTAWDDSTPQSARFMILDTKSDGGLRSSSEVLTGAGLAAQLAADPRFADARERCAELESLQRWRGAFRPADIEAAGCPATALVSSR
jgi:para-nitrobenzyl esterase